MKITGMDERGFTCLFVLPKPVPVSPAKFLSTPPSEASPPYLVSDFRMVDAPPGGVPVFDVAVGLQCVIEDEDNE